MSEIVQFECGSLYIYIYIYIYACVNVCACVISFYILLKIYNLRQYC